MQKQPSSREDIEGESARLAKSFLAGERRAFDKLILLHQRWVFNLCYRMLGDYDDADDCAQEVFIKVNRSLKKFRFESSFQTWLYRIATNTCKTRLTSLEHRLRSKRVRIDMEGDNEEEPKRVDIEDHSPSPVKEVFRKEIDRLIQIAIDALPAAHKMVVVLRDIEGRSYEEIVEITGNKLGTVKSQLSRARQQLREALEGKI